MNRPVVACLYPSAKKFKELQVHTIAIHYNGGKNICSRSVPAADKCLVSLVIQVCVLNTLWLLKTVTHQHAFDTAMTFVN